MSKIRSGNTKPKMVVRKYLHSLGFRYRTHRENLPGKPDIALKKYNTVIFINGCFWHQHSCKKGRTFPKKNQKFWKKPVKQCR